MNAYDGPLPFVILVCGVVVLAVLSMNGSALRLWLRTRHVIRKSPGRRLGVTGWCTSLVAAFAGPLALPIGLLAAALGGAGWILASKNASPEETLPARMALVNGVVTSVMWGMFVGAVYWLGG